MRKGHLEKLRGAESGLSPGWIGSRGPGVLWKSGCLSAFRKSLFSIRAEQQEGPAERQPLGEEKKQVFSTGSACLGAHRLLASVPRGWKGSLSSLALNLAWVLNLK